MYKNQLQELAQRSCFNLPAYTSFREGPDHAPRFKAAVNFNGETFESPSYCSTLRQAEHSAAEVALDALASRGPSNSLAARILDETGVYKNLLQEVSQRVGASLPAYTTFRTGLGHLPVFTCTVELAGVIFTGEPAKNKKQAEKNAAMAAWLSLKSLVQQYESSSSEKTHKDEQEHVTAARALQKYLIMARLEKISFPVKFPTPNPRPSSMQQSPASTSKILPLICPKITPRHRVASNNSICQKTVQPTHSQPLISISNESISSLVDNLKTRPQKFPAAGAAPYIPVRHCSPHQRIAPPVTIRNVIPVFSAPPVPSPQSSMVMRPPPLGMVPPVCVRQAVPLYSPPVRKEEVPKVHPVVKIEDPRLFKPATSPAENLPISRAAVSRLEESKFPKVPLVRVEEPLGSKLSPVCETPDSEVPVVQTHLRAAEVTAIQVASPVSEVNNPTTTSNQSAEEARTTLHDKLPESAGVEDFSELKI
ncbi:double-stranded RNA-binding protein 2-like [Dorcoceras hygrometricum]|uniref:Double-stranded RNA-binding protein 2-like n=1 Tax=Dorcoceras hygrometricum TaxID=472368 RepID=A0A2Z7BUN2_9LAMI|nr:double-stranded RNA-binding protein 2-like [Dorcoceras hygrometricum]